MKTYKQLTEEKKDMQEMRGLVEVYEEIAAKKMQAVREAILSSRAFFEGLAKLSEDVGADFSQFLNRVDPGSTHSVTAVVFISANEGLYGDIIERVFQAFLSFIKKDGVDVFVVGRVGAELMDSYAKGISYKKMEIGDDKIDEEEFSQVAKQLLPYKNIVVFYGRFQSIVNQEASSMTISGEMLQRLVPEYEDVTKHMRYLYEPTLVDISNIFGNEIMASTLEASVRESQLAKFASRMMNLDVAMERIDEHLIKVGFERLKIHKRSLDKKQRQIISGVVVRRHA